MPKTDCRAPSIKVLAKSAASDNLNPLGRLVSSRLTRRSHPDCRATLVNGVAADIAGAAGDQYCHGLDFRGERAASMT
jgi:hypothetical protein